MASTRPNPFGSATPIGEGLANVFGAFMQAPTPEQRAKAALDIYGLQAAGKRDLAAAGYDDARTQGQTIQNNALASLPTLDFNSPGAQGTVMQTMGGNYSSLADPFLVHMARQPGVHLQNMDPLVYAKNGNAGNTFTGFREDQGRQFAQNAADNTRALQTNAADNARALQVERMQQEGLDRRFSVNTPAGSTTTLAPGNPTGQTTIQGNPTPQTVQGEIASKFIENGGNVNQPLSPQTPLGAAFDTKNPPSDGMSLTVGADGTVQMQQGGGLPLSSSVVGDNLDAQDAIESYLRTSNELRTIATQGDPTIFGTVGNIRRLFQSAATQADLALQMVGKSDPNAVKTADSVFDTVLQDLAMAGVQDPTVYGPNLTDIDKMAILAAYKAASAVANQEGRDLSNEDFSNFRTIVGDPTAWGSTKQSFLAGLNRLDRMALLELNARRARLNQPPIDPTKFGQTTQTTFAPPNEQQIAYLRANPSLAPQFDQKFGPGAAAKVLGMAGR